MNAGRRSLVVSSAVAVAAALAAVAAPGQVWLRLPLGLPLVALLPGYGVVRALFPMPGRDAVKRVTISMALSISAVIFLGLVLGRAGAGLGVTSWTLALVALTLAANAVALVRARGLGVAGARERLRVSTALAASAALAGCVLVLAVVVSMPDAYRPANGELVQLWALPPDAARPRDITVGVSNQLSDWRYFRLAVVHADMVITEKSLFLQPGDSMAFSVRMPGELSAMTPVRVVLTPEIPAAQERMVAIWPEPAWVKRAK